MSVTARIELLAPGGAVRAENSQEVELQPGLNPLRFDLPGNPIFRKGSLDDLLWYRLRYLIMAKSPPGRPIEPASGIISLDGIMPQMFELHVASPMFAKESSRCYARIRAIHPVTGRPVSGVTVRLRVNITTMP